MKYLHQLVCILLALNLPLVSSAKAQKAYLSSEGKAVVNAKVFERNWYGLYPELNSAMKDHAEAYKAASRYRDDLKLGMGLVFTGLFASLAYAVSTNTYKSSNFWGLFLLGYFPGVFKINSARKQLYKSVNLYNGIPETQARKSIKFNFSPSLINTDSRTMIPGVSLSARF